MRLGAHVSIAGGLTAAIDRGVALGAECLQIFVSSPRAWQPATHSEEEVARFRARVAEAEIYPIIVHTIYLLNFASPDQALRNRSIQSLASALRWAERLGVLGAVTHLGSDRGQQVAEAEAVVAAGLGTALRESPGNARLLLETSAGHTVGGNFAQLGRIIRLLDNDPRLAVCLDTAHVFAAGYEVTTAEGLEAMLADFDREIGLVRLLAIHANDSKSGKGTGIDRHENIGRGHLGEEAFARLLCHPALRKLPFILEVPGMDGNGPDRENLAILRRLTARGPKTT